MLLDTEFWEFFVRSDSSDLPPPLRGLGTRASHAIEKMHQLLNLLTRDQDRMEDKDGRLRTESNLQLILHDHEYPSSTQRVLDAISSISILYKTLSKLHDNPGDELAFVGCDSGSDKSFDFTGVPQIIEQTKSIIMEIWDRVIFFRERKHVERVKAIAESLPILSKI